MGSKTATQARNAQRQADTAELMENIMTGGEISKKREAELRKAADAGRGIQFIQGSPTVGNLYQIDKVTGEKKPVFRTGATAEDYTGRIAASAPTFSELLGDAGRALVGGTADKQKFTLPTSMPGTPSKDFANMVPDPRPTQGIIPALVNTGGVTGIIFDALKDLYSSGTDTVRNMANFLSPLGKPQPDPFSSGADATGGAFVLPGSLVPQNLERESLIGEIERNRLKQLIANDVAPGSSELNVDEMSDREVELRLQTYDEPFATGGRVGFRVGGNVMSLFTDYDGSFDRSMFDAMYGEYLEDNRGKGLYEFALDFLGAAGSFGDLYKSGGLVPPTSGPQSEGIGSLFKNK